MKSFNLVAVFIVTLAAALASTASRPSAESPATPASAPTAGSMTMADGEVRKVDKAAKKITLKHGEIRNLDMPAMTMVFQVKDTALLDKVKAGDKVKFKAEKITGGYAASEIELTK
jgi:Cu/Ag efflux protein CusF